LVAAGETDENFDRWEVSYDGFHPAGEDTVVVLVAVALRTRSSGLEMAQPIAWVVEFADDRFRRIRSFVDHEQALRVPGRGSPEPHARRRHRGPSRATRSVGGGW